MPNISCTNTPRRRRRASNVHRPSRTVYPPDCDISLREEARKTRDWLLRHDRWTGPNIFRLVRQGDEQPDLAYSFFPITDRPDKPEISQDSEYYLSYDSDIYRASEDGELSVFEIHPSLDSENDVEYLIEKLRLIRGE